MALSCTFSKQQVKSLLELADMGIRGNDLKDAMADAHADLLIHAKSCQPCADTLEMVGILAASQEGSTP